MHENYPVSFDVCRSSKKRVYDFSCLMGGKKGEDLTSQFTIEYINDIKI